MPGFLLHPVYCVFRMKIKENMGVFEYNVKFNPIIDSLQEKKAIIRGLTDLTGKSFRLRRTSMDVPFTFS